VDVLRGRGCLILLVLVVLGFAGRLAVLGSSGGGGSSTSGSSKRYSEAKQSAVGIGDPITVGDVEWTVTDARQTKQLTQQGVSKQFAKIDLGNFVIVDFDFTNNGSDPVTLDSTSLG
jgi:hypothetical protein